MTRGKYAEKAAKRRAELEVTTDLASYQHRVAKLIDENRDLRQQLNEQRQSFAATERRLRAQRDEGVAPQVEALRLALVEAKREHRDRIRNIGKIVGGVLIRHEVHIDSRGWADIMHVTGLTWGELTGLGARVARRTRPTEARATANLSLADQAKLSRKAERSLGHDHGHDGGQNA